MLQQLTFSIYRPSRSPSVDIPFGVRSCGHYRVHGNFTDMVLTKPFVEIFWGVNGTGALIIDGKECTLGPQQCAIYFTNMQHQVFATGEDWEYRWFTLDGSLAESTLRSFGFTKAGVYDVGAIPQPLFQNLINNLEDVSPYGERLACTTAFEILTTASSQLKTPIHRSKRQRSNAETIAQALDFIHKNWMDPMVGVEQISKMLGMHRSSFSKLFQAEVGLTPKDYITRIRVQYALNKLRQSSQSIKEIAQEAGWEDPNYFSRCIKAATGFSPSQYRKQAEHA